MAGAPNTSEPAQPFRAKLLKLNAERNHAHEHQQLGDGQYADDQFEGCGQFHAEDVEAHEHDVRADGGVFRVERRELHVQVGADGQCDGRRGEDEFDQRRESGDQTAFFAKGPAAISERSAGVGNGGGQFSEAEDEAGVHGRDHERCHQKAQRAGDTPAVAPTEIFAGYHQADGDAP